MELEQREHGQLRGVEEKRDLQTRFLAGLHQPPIQGVLYTDGQWTQMFLEGVKRVDAVCQERQICHHGLDHIIRVSQNALILMDMVHEDYAAAGYSLDATGFSDSEVFFPALVHDIGYALTTVAWQDQNAINHAEQGAYVLERVRNKILPKVIDPTHPSLHLLAQHAPLYHSAIAGNTETMLAYASSYANMGIVSPQVALPLAVMVADKLDYFREKRVEGLQSPQAYEDNPYFFLADAVATYVVTYDEEVLRYTVFLKRNFQIPREIGECVVDPKIWKEETEIYYIAVLNLAKAFANLVGRKFEVVVKMY